MQHTNLLSREVLSPTKAFFTLFKGSGMAFAPFFKHWNIHIQHSSSVTTLFMERMEQQPARVSPDSIMINVDLKNLFGELNLVTSLLQRITHVNNCHRC